MLRSPRFLHDAEWVGCLYSRAVLLALPLRASAVCAFVVCFHWTPLNMGTLNGKLILVSEVVAKGALWPLASCGNEHALFGILG